MVIRPRRKKTARPVGSIPGAERSVTMSAEPIGDHQGYLAVALAAAIVAIVALTVVMIVLAAT